MSWFDLSVDVGVGAYLRGIDAYRKCCLLQQKASSFYSSDMKWDRQNFSLRQANKLSTIKKCLNEVLKFGGPYTPRDLYPYHLALHQIDQLRKDGKFHADDGSIPEGQAILVAQLSEAHELLEMLKESMSDDEDDEEEV